MEQYKKEFIEFMVESDVLKFGEFTLKSGRKSPFFMNAGAYVTGSQLKRNSCRKQHAEKHKQKHKCRAVIALKHDYSHRDKSMDCQKQHIPYIVELIPYLA